MVKLDMSEFCIKPVPFDMVEADIVCNSVLLISKYPALVFVKILLICALSI